MRRLLPPTLFAPLLVLTVAAGLVLPVAGPISWALRWIGAPVALFGAWLTIGGAGRFERVGTNIKTFDDPDQLVVDGPFRVTRNPMYLGFTLMLAGAALLVGTLSAWCGAVVFFVVANLWYVPFEEQRMLERFGDDYEHYRTRVSRWVTVPGVGR